jgi:thiamine-monophosphate kinase
MGASKPPGIQKIGEFGLISRFQSLLKHKSPQTILGIGDDCAVFNTDKGRYQVISTDALVEGVHFDLKTHSAKILAEKSLAVNLSDIAAMGAEPKIALISIAIPNTLSKKFLDQFYRSLDNVSHQYNIEIVGGDTVSSLKHLFINIVIIGEAKKNRIFTRKGAKPGDKIFVTGSLGDSSLGLKILTSPKRKWKGSQTWQKSLKNKHLSPNPRVAFSQILANSKLPVTAMIDISDGLLQDLGHICQQSEVGADLIESCIPMSDSFIKFSKINNLQIKNHVLSGGEDYELLFTLKPENDKKLKPYLNSTDLPVDLPVTYIGDITNSTGKIFLTGGKGNRKTLQKPDGFDHFNK